MKMMTHGSIAPTKPYTDKTWAYVVLNVEEFLAADSDARMVKVHGVLLTYGEIRRRNRERDWARFNDEVA